MEVTIAVFGLIAVVIAIFWADGTIKERLKEEDEYFNPPSNRRQAARNRDEMKALGLIRASEHKVSHEVSDSGSLAKWEKLSVPENRPDGKWANWKFGSGWVKVKGTSNYLEDVNDFADFIEGCTDGIEKEFSIDLIREPTNPHDPDAIRVEAYVPTWPKPFLTLGYVDASAAAWLAANFDPDMPIAASLVKFAMTPDAASITICGLMPPKKERREFEL